MKGRPEHDRDDRRGFNVNAALDASPRVAAQSSSSALPLGGGGAGAPAPCRVRAKEREERRGLFDPLRAGLRRQSNPTVDYFQYMYTVPTRSADRSGAERSGAEGRAVGEEETRRGGTRPNPRSTRVSAYTRPTAVSTVDLCGRHRDISLKASRRPSGSPPVDVRK